MQSSSQTAIACDIQDPALAETGRRYIDWAFQSMPVLQTVRKQFIKTQPFAGIRVAACLHVTAETANLMITLRDGGASPVLCAATSATTQDEVAASLVRDYGIPVFAKRAETPEQFHGHLLCAAEDHPQLLLDETGDLLQFIHTQRSEQVDEIAGASAELGAVIRLRTTANNWALGFPVIAANEAHTRRLFDNRYGAGQSTLEGIMGATNVLLAGLHFVVAGYGRCGRGIAARARGLGASVIVTEVDAMKAIEAAMDGFRVMSMGEAAAIADVFCTVTGNKNVLAREHFDKMKNGAMLANAGHFTAEIDLETLGKMSSSKRRTREQVEEYSMRDGRKIYVLGQGRMINLASAQGHPATVTDIGLANQALSIEYIIKNQGALEKRIYPVPDEIDKSVAKLKLEAMGTKIDRLTVEQEQYLAGWSEGI